MLKSMTGYGRASIVTGVGRFVVDVHSVNRKHLEVHLSLPPDFLCFDNELRQLVAKYMMRGQVTVRVSGCFEQDALIKMSPNLPRVRQIKHAWDEIAQVLKFPMTPEFSASVLMQQPDLLLQESTVHENVECRNTLLKVVENALMECVEARKREGAVLKADILERLGTLESLVRFIKKEAPIVVERYRTKLQNRLQEMLPSLAESDPSVLREVCLYADRVDIAEEVTRYEAHLKLLREMLTGKTECHGKKLDFLLQELMREISTMGSKMLDTLVSRVVIDSKAELERIREQIQNIE